MHRALAIPEIVRTILDSFHEKGGLIRVEKDYYLATRALRSSVLNVALTCRSFSEPALDILWWTMDDLIPLFNLLPGFRNEQEIYFPISEHALEVFDRFANRIRVCCMTDKLRDRVNIASYISVLQTLGRFYLLPRLRYIYTERNEPQLLFFGSPLLHTFHVVRKTEESTFIQSFLDLLPSASPKTEVLLIQSSLRERCLNAISRMPKLRLLMTDFKHTDSRLPLGADFMAKFASRQTLFYWCLDGNISIAPLPASGFSVSIFHNLSYLTFKDNEKTSIAEYTTLFRVGQFPSLKKLDIRLTVDRTPGQSPSPTKLWRDFFKHLRSATTNSFSILNVQIRGSIVSQVCFEDLPDLQTFTLNKFTTNLLRSLPAANLLTILACWPDLTCLQIAGVDQVAISFSSLVEIASQSPHLEDLEIQINCMTFPTINDVPILQHDLKTLNLSPRNLENHIALARCIDRIFPNLVVLNISGSPPFLKPGVGKEIQEIYEALQSAKKVQKERENFPLQLDPPQKSSHSDLQSFIEGSQDQ